MCTTREKRAQKHRRKTNTLQVQVSSLKKSGSGGVKSNFFFLFILLFLQVTPFVFPQVTLKLPLVYVLLCKNAKLHSLVLTVILF